MAGRNRWEYLWSIAKTMNFRLKIGGFCIKTEEDIGDHAKGGKTGEVIIFNTECIIL